MHTDPDCLFCKIIAGEIPCDKVYEDETMYAFRDIAPQAPTHILLVPKHHIERLSDLSDADTSLMGTLLLTARTIAAQEGLSDYRTVINCGEQAGQSVWHIHLHLLGGRGFGWPPG